MRGGKRVGKLKEIDTHPTKLTSRHGAAGLWGSFGTRIDEQAMTGAYGSDKDYAAIQEFGGQAGRGRQVTIPARPGLKRTIDTLRDEITDILYESIRKRMP